MDERVYKIGISLIQGIGIIKTKTLVAYLGGAKAFFEADEKDIAAQAKISLKKVRSFKRSEALKRAEQEVAFMDNNNVQLHYYLDANYPPALKFCDDGPIVLYSKGNINFNKENVAIVGTRKATAYGKKLTADLVKDLSKLDIQIISGLAHGIDKEAHQAAIENNLPTIAVLGHGLELIYPAAHKNLANQMMENGGVVTEFISYYPGDPSNFPKRNRIVAGLSQATVVIESAQTGGSLITANLAHDYNREVFAFPGDINRPYSSGCNNLIQRNIAHLITSADDMFAIMDWEIDDRVEVVQSDLFEAMTQDEEKICKALKTAQDSLHIDDLSHAVEMSTSELSLHLFNLEMKGTINALAGKKYRLV